MFELGTDGPSVILAAVDGSATSLRAAAYAAGLCRRQRSRLVVIIVHTLGSTAVTAPGAAQIALETNAQLLQELRETMAKESPRLGIDVTLLERSGDPLGEISRLADEIRADAVVLGASTHAAHRFVGSLATRLVRSARWPITVVP